MGFIKFSRDAVHSFAWMQLMDLARTLSHQEMKLDKAFYSHFDGENSIIYVSQFWSTYTPEVQTAGWKGEVVLRAGGSAQWTDGDAVLVFLKRAEHDPLMKLAKALFALGEDLRLEKKLRMDRPGTNKLFDHRKKVLGDYFAKRLGPHVQKGEDADALLIEVYLWAQNNGRPSSQVALEKWMQAESTAEVAEATWGLIETKRSDLRNDLLYQYFSTTNKGGAEAPKPPIHFESDMKRHKRLQNDDKSSTTKESEPSSKEKLSTWHRETDSPSLSMLRFDLERGTKTEIMSGNSVRESDSGDQALAQVQGYARSSVNRSAEQSRGDLTRVDNAGERDQPPFGAANVGAIAVNVPIHAPTYANVEAYSVLSKEVRTEVNRLKRTIRMTMEHRKTAPRTELAYGRLGRKLTKAVTEAYPRMFYKKINPSTKVDAAFLLLVDCSASMWDKMEETLKGITLFHEALRSLQISHSVVGFWEDTDQAKDNEYPNFFQEAISFRNSLMKSSGPNLLQLEPQMDNRDGYAIRQMTRKLLNCTGKQKLLIVFSDGEPSAANYFEEGISDTSEAVQEARRNGLEVISVFLGGGEVSEGIRETMRSIYGRHSLIVPSVSELPNQMSLLLKKLLLKAL